MKLFDVYPLFDIEIKSGKGCYTYDTEGNEYLDLYGGHAVISIGHSHPYYINKITSAEGFAHDITEYAAFMELMVMLNTLFVRNTEQTTAGKNTSDTA